MMIPIKRDDDPKRCQGVSKHGQCRFEKEDGSEYCMKHGGHHAANNKEKKDLSNYRLTKYQGRLAEMKDSGKLFSLRDEIGILRIMLEEIINHVSNTDISNLIAYSPKIADIATRIEKLVLSCNKLDKELGDYLDRKAVIQMAIEIVSIISEFVTDTDKLEEIANRIAEVLGRSDEENIPEDD